MPDFIGPFKEGLKAAEVADRARSEIDGVFSELSHQMQVVSDGKIAIARRECHAPISTLDIMANPFKPRKTYWAILAWNPTVPNNSSKELATWSQDPAGYPCKIAYGKWERTCEDREALENSLAELLRDPIVGEKLYSLTKLVPANEATAQGEGSGAKSEQ